MNAMLYVRGRPLDYDLWVEQGAPGLGLAGRAAVLPALGGQRPRRLGVPRRRRRDDDLRAALAAAARPAPARGLRRPTGIPRIDDYNGPEQDGVSMFQVFQKNGRRWSAADAFLRPALKRPNLEVVTGATVLGLELDGDRAVGRPLPRQARRRDQPPAPSAR